MQRQRHNNNNEFERIDRTSTEIDNLKMMDEHYVQRSYVL
jgi:hypothetical protein